MIGSGMEAENNDTAMGGQGWLDTIVNSFLNGGQQGFGAGGIGVPGGASSNPAGQGLGMQGLPPAASSAGPAASAASAGSGTNYAALAQQYGPGIVGIITALMRRNNGQGGSDGLVPPEVQQMLQEHMRRMQATGPLFDQLNTQARAGLPRTS